MSQILGVIVLEQGNFGFGWSFGTGATLQVLSRLRRDVGFSLRPGLWWAFCGLHVVFGTGDGSGVKEFICGRDLIMEI